MSVIKWFDTFSTSLNADFWNDVLIYSLIVAACVVLYYLLRMMVIHVVKRLVNKSKVLWDDALYESRFFHRICWLIPLPILYHFTDVFLGDYHYVYSILETIIRLLFIFLFMFIIKSFLHSIEIRYNADNERKRSIKGLMQAVSMVLYVITAIIIFSILLGKSTASVLTGLGAASAVFMLVFKDSIVGFVSGIQLASNDMIRLGDWVEIAAGGADGEVIDITMITVKIRNWDNTIVSIPAYDFISKSFKNWRGMQELGIRRVKRSIFIDMNSVKYCSEEMLSRFQKYEFLNDYISKTQLEMDAYNKQHEFDKSLIINGKQQSNLGVFRMYVLRYLQNNENVCKTATLMVRQLQPTENGIPIEVYAFTKTTEWLPYEKIQSDIFDHIIAAVPFFDLRIYQRSSDKN
ncbi:MAG: mechanosensitive ion channel [Bacteroidales bacterium]|nr:mechanosensitive ion channel [Bacteroidales bacterium]